MGISRKNASRSFEVDFDVCVIIGSLDTKLLSALIENFTDGGGGSGFAHETHQNHDGQHIGQHGQNAGGNGDALGAQKDLEALGTAEQQAGQ